MRVLSLVAGLCAGAFASPLLQDPAPTTTPTPVAPPTAAAKEVPGRPARHPFEGVYVLRKRSVDGKVDPLPSRGYLAITGRHLFLTVAVPGPDRDQPLVRTSVRQWTQAGELTTTTILLGWLTDQEGAVVVEPPGTEEKRRCMLVKGGLRIEQDPRNWLEFERVE
ncbi:MAG: hypothetical protein JNK15_17415 [Planctomycetes bacterium]|nr:hypothetical protein [Planctomycetota bacterium]